MRYAILTSGSCGNCYAFYDGKSAILIDDGLTLTGLKKRLADVDIPFGAITDVFVTHSHPDHSKGLGVLRRSIAPALHASRLSITADERVYARLGLTAADFIPFDFGTPVQTGDYSLTPFPTSHDAAGSAGYLVENGESRFFLMTDTGVLPEMSHELALRANVLFIESNYDETMLEAGAYPAFLKRRISGVRGHLSNRQAHDFIGMLPCDGRRIFLIHLSDNNNTPQAVRGLYSGSAHEPVVCERGATYGGYDVQI